MPTEGWIRFTPPERFDDATAGFGPRRLELIRTLVRHLISLRPMRWTTLKRYAKGGLDLVDVEQTVQAMHRARWLELRFKRDVAGDRMPTQLRLAEDAVDDASALLGTPSPTQRRQQLDTLISALRRLRDQARAPVPERVFVHRVFGHTKALRVRDHRRELEQALGVELEQLLRFHVDIALTAGPARFRFEGTPVDLAGSAPWTALTEPVAQALDHLELRTEQLICVENQTVFEALLYEGLATDAVVLFTSGYLGTVQKAWLAKLVGAGIRSIRHWGDLDPWGLDIYRDLRDVVRRLDSGIDVTPWRMGPAPLERSDTRKLNPDDWIKLHQYLKRDDAPLRETALAMKRLGCKLEQEALLSFDA